MKKRSRILFVLSCAGLLGIGSCTKVLDNLSALNTNENQPLNASSPTLLTAAEFSGVMLDQGSFVTNGDGDGFLGIFAEHMAGNHAQGLQYNTYVLTHKSFQFLFNDAYVSSLMNLKLLIANAKAGEEGYVGIAQVLQAYQLGYLTSVYGDLPWTQALDVLAYPNPTYDSQENIYDTVQSLLSRGIANLQIGSNVTSDFIYDGDMDKWIAAAYLLKARFYNHFSKKDPAGSAASALEAVDNALAAGFAANKTDGDFTLKYDGETGPTTNPWVSMYLNSMLVANKPFLDQMIAENDPRINDYFTSIDFNGNDVYGLGKTITGTVGTGEYMYIGGSYDPSNDPYNIFGQYTSPVYLATYPELKMIEAEAAFRSGDLTRAAEASNEAVISQLDAVVTDPPGLAAKPAYITAHATETAGTITMAKIMDEKFKLMFTMEAESWMDCRRTDFQYPSWLSIPTLDDADPTPAGPTFIQRLLYPQSELNNNGANVPSVPGGIFEKLPILQ